VFPPAARKRPENEGVYHLLQSIGYFHGAMCLTMTFFAAFPTVLTGRRS
jgi:hypothetical protein